MSVERLRAPGAALAVLKRGIRNGRISKVSSRWTPNSFARERKDGRRILERREAAPENPRPEITPSHQAVPHMQRERQVPTEPLRQTGKS